MSKLQQLAWSLIAVLALSLGLFWTAAPAQVSTAKPSDAQPSSRIAKGVYLGFDGDHLGDSRSQKPDGKLDHHIRLEGLRHPIAFIEVKAGKDADGTDWKWSDRAGEETNPKYAPGGWWWAKHEPRIPGSPVGVMDLWLSEPTPDKPHTDFRVYVFYSEDIKDRDSIIPEPLPSPRLRGF